MIMDGDGGSADDAVGLSGDWINRGDDVRCTSTEVGP